MSLQMKREIGIFLLASCAALAVRADGDWRPSERWRGFNLKGMCVWKPDGAKPKFSESDFALVKEWGFNFVRLPLDYRFWIKDGDWHSIDADRLAPVDEAVEWGRKYGLHVQICFHHAPGYCINGTKGDVKLLFDDAKRPEDSRSPDALSAFAEHWRAFARRYRGIPNERLSFNLVNEPPGLDDAEVRRVFLPVIEAIRAEDAERFIVADGLCGGLDPVPPLEGLHNVGFATRGYRPLTFSHYGANWFKDAYKRVPKWPYEVEDGARRYPDDGREYLYRVALSKWNGAVSGGQFVMVGECGGMNSIPHEMFLAWMEDYLKLWKERGWGWALWEIDSAFGVLDSGRKDVEYEDFRGHRLDRALLSLLQKY